MQWVLEASFHICSVAQSLVVATCMRCPACRRWVATLRVSHRRTANLKQLGSFTKVGLGQMNRWKHSSFSNKRGTSRNMELSAPGQGGAHEDRLKLESKWCRAAQVLLRSENSGAPVTLWGACVLRCKHNGFILSSAQGSQNILTWLIVAAVKGLPLEGFCFVLFFCSYPLPFPPA